MRNSFDSKKELATLSLDLDNHWAYTRAHGDPDWGNCLSYFNVFVPQILEILDNLNLKITFFVVGQDAALKNNEAALAQITERGHEVGNHSFSHEPWFHKYSRDRIEEEILTAEKWIMEVTGQKPVGFRGPCFCWNRELMDVLKEHGYVYDASTLPTYLGPVARLYYFATSFLSDEEKNRRKDLYGSIGNGLWPVKPYHWKLSSGNLFLEIPVTTMPFLKLPFHLSYLLFISQFSEPLMEFYLNLAILTCKIARTGPSFLLHPLDFLDTRQFPELFFFPAMKMAKEHKLRIFRRVYLRLSNHFEFVKMSAYAESILNSKNLKVRKI